MSQIVQCDFCGLITSEPAAHILIQTREDRERNQKDYTYQGTVKDACGPCLDKFLIVPKSRILTAEIAEKV